MAPTQFEKATLLTKPIVIGLYGLPGSGKSYLLEQLRTELREEKFAYYEGSTVLSSLVFGGLDAFKKLDDQEKDSVRKRAIHQIAQDCSTCRKVGIVTGHFLFWGANSNDDAAKSVWTDGDAETYTHILYLDISPEIVHERRQNDLARVRPVVSTEILGAWQRIEHRRLLDTCLENGIIFSIIHPSKVISILSNIENHTEQYNLSCAEGKLDTIVRSASADTVFVFDGDRTLIPEDTGALFVELMLKDGLDTKDPLKAVFQSMGYSYNAFRQISFVYEAMDKEQYDYYCLQVAESVSVYPEILSLLKRATQQGVAAVVITCGLRAIWETILNRAGCSETVQVVGGGRVGDGLIITSEVKAALVVRLRDVHHKYVCAFGDSVLDLPMLKEADRAVVIVGAENKRSTQMDKALLNAIEHENLYACQVLLPPTVSPRLDTLRLPSVDINSKHFISSIVSPVAFATENAAKLLMTPMRNSTIFGPDLRIFHARVGQHLANALLSDRIGLEEYPILHVQGNVAIGYRFRNEGKTSIVALMRGGEPMAMGVNEAMPLAMFIHAKVPDDVKQQHVHNQEMIILVDSVVNTGKSIVEFVHHIRKLNDTVHIMVVAGVVQAKALSRTILAQILMVDSHIDFVALRRSDNKFTGRGTTDTGNRLFNTTQLE